MGRLDGSPVGGAVTVIFEDRFISVLVVYDECGKFLDMKIDDRTI